MAGGGDVNVHCIASSEDVVTLIFVVAYRWGVAVGVRGVAPYFSGLGWFGADAKKRKVEK